MGERTSYAPGTFSWTDLTTTDQPAGKRFYEALFGWEADDRPAGEGIVYSMMSLSGKSVSAISPQPEQQREAGVPPTWNSYITVESADGALEKARELGATVHAPAFDVFDAGRMGVVQDPQGAFFCVWQPKENIGAQLVNGPGALSWNELASPDVDASTDFYTELFGWQITPLEGGPTSYWTIQNSAGHGNGGIRAATETEPPYWLVYFGTDDVAGSLAKVGDLGGGELVGATDIGQGATIGMARDPQGAVFAFYAGRFEN